MGTSPPSQGDDILASDRDHAWHPFARLADPIEIVQARGAWLIAADGRRYLDLIGSWWVCLHGHGHPHIAGAIAQQASQLDHVLFAGFTHRPAARLAARLAALAPDPLTRVFYSDSGSTSIEIALKMAWQYVRSRGRPGDDQRQHFLAFEGGYHGDTIGAMSAGFSSGLYTAFDGLRLPFDFAPYAAVKMGDNDAQGKERQALDKLDQMLADKGDGLVGVVIEPLIQGAAGMRICRPEFVRAVAKRVQDSGAILIYDEVMTGFGRTGTMFASDQVGVAPDILCLAKGLTGGFLPLAATMCSEDMYQAIGDSFAHGHSYTANPLGCAAALASLDLFDHEDSFTRIQAIGDIHRRYLSQAAARPNVANPRCCGVVAACDIVGDDGTYGGTLSRRIQALALEHGLLLRPLGNVLYCIPPYGITPEDLTIGWQEILAIIDHLAQEKVR